MAITLFDVNNKIIEHHDLQDKLRWCVDGETKEQAFVRRYGLELGYQMNPTKVTDPYAPDLLFTKDNLLTDLKSQHTPFFKSQSLYGIEPTYAVVFNVKDKERYIEHYPNIDILYYIEWVALKADIYGKSFQVNPLVGVYRISFKNLLTILDDKKIHKYQQRVGDTKGNARDSYVIDIRNPLFEQIR
ncbi:hypothetical protein [Fluviicola sp.]|uniref:hypothetical protein n=1 Tax=Fluviicola sp. TaxID=1917219 RepID=UPI002609168C|nr:hypothetical protein [Fluviicola sp.]